MLTKTDANGIFHYGDEVLDEVLEVGCAMSSQELGFARFPLDKASGFV
jgi:hypothetical protein